MVYCCTPKRVRAPLVTSSQLMKTVCAMTSSDSVAMTAAAPDRRMSGKPTTAASSVAMAAPMSSEGRKGRCTFWSTG